MGGKYRLGKDDKGRPTVTLLRVGDERISARLIVDCMKIAGASEPCPEGERIIILDGSEETLYKTLHVLNGWLWGDEKGCTVT